MDADHIKSADDVRRTFNQVISETRENKAALDDQKKSLGDVEAAQDKMRKDLEVALEAQRKLNENARPQPSGFGSVKVPDDCDTPAKMATHAANLDWSDHQDGAAATIARVHSASDAVAMQFVAAKGLMKKDDFNAESKRWFNEKVFRGKLFQEYIGAMEDLYAKNINTENPTEGLEWVPDEVKSGMFIDRIRDASFFAGLFTQVAMAGKTYSIPALGGDTAIFVVPELTGGRANHPTTPESKPASREVIFATRKIGTSSIWSRESVEDMTIQTGQVIMDNIARNMADTLDYNTLFGDRTLGVHTGTGYNTGEALSLFDGITAHCFANGYTTDAQSPGDGVVGWQDLGDMLANMGQKAGSRFSMSNTGANGSAFWVTWKSFFNLVSEENTYGPSPIVTLEQYGPGATIIDGEAARIFGRPIIPTEWIPDDITPDGDRDTVPGNTTGAIAANFGAWGLGTRRGMEMRTSTDVYLESDAVVAVSFWRGDFQPLQDITSDPIAWYLVNVLP